MLPSFDGKPVFVLDLNAIQALSAQSLRLPTGYLYVLPDVALREVATTDGSRRTPQLVKMYDFVLANKDQLLISKYWQDVSRNEIHVGFGTNPEGVIEWDLTRAIRNESFPSVQQYLANSDSLDLDSSNHELDKQGFTRLIQRLAVARQSSEHYTGRMANEMRANPDHRTKYIQQPDAISHWLKKHPNTKYRDSNWKSALEVFPDVHAMGRWLRVMTWYEMLYTISLHTKDFANNYEDAQYAFTASYFDGLITQDRVLIECVDSVFPNVEIIRDFNDIAVFA